MPRDISKEVADVLSEIGCPQTAAAASQVHTPYSYDVAAMIRDTYTPNSPYFHGTHALFSFVNEFAGGLATANDNLRSSNREYDCAQAQFQDEIKALQAKLAIAKTNFDDQQTQLHAQNAQLHAAQAKADAQNGQLQSQAQMIADLTARPTHGGTHHKKSIAKDPDAFDASEKDESKRYTEYQNWRSKVLIRWAQDAHDFTDETSKILHIASPLSGQAYQSIQRGITTILDNPLNSTVWAWPSGAALMAILDKTYCSLDIVAEAEKKLSVLEQKGDYKVFSDFITEFTHLCDRADIDDTSRVRFLRLTISARLRKAIVHQINQPSRSDWTGWLDLVTKLSQNIEHDDFQSKLHQPAPKTNNNSGGGGGAGAGGSQSNGNSIARRDPDAMDLNNVNAPRISPEENWYRTDNGLCRRCGRPGHIAVNCTPAVRAAAPPRGGPSARGSSRGGRGAWRGGGRGFGQPQNYQQFQPQYQQQFQQPYQQRPSQPNDFQLQGHQIRTANVQHHLQYPQYHTAPLNYDTNPYPIGYVVEEVDDVSTVDNDQGKGIPLR